MSALDLVMRCRRRVRFLLAVRYGAIACAGTIVLTAATFFVSSLPIQWVLLVATSAGAGVLCGATVAFWRCPRPIEIAKDVDRRLGLDDSLTAALEAGGSRAPIAPLILHYAAERGRRLNARQLFPLDVRVPAVALAIAAASLLVVAGLRGGSPSTNGRPGAERAAASGGDGSTLPSRPARPSETARSSNPPSLTTASARVPEGQPIAAADAPTLRPPSSSLVASSSTEGQSGRRGTSPQSARDSSPGANGGPSRSGSGALGTSGGRASGAGAGSGSGGVRGGGLSDAESIARAAGPPSAAYAARYAQARRNVEAAMSRDEVPPDLRPYVRQYFLAIRPREGRE